MTVAQNMRADGVPDPDATGEQTIREPRRQSGVYRSAQTFLLRTSLVAAALPFVFAAQASTFISAISVSAVGVGIGLASMAVGALFGFLFGIPTTLQGNRAPSPPTDDRRGPAGKSQYSGNTSLEQISDWLTKILVGVGLTQLAAIPAGLTSIGHFLAAGLGGLPGADVFATVLFIFALLDGFFLSYLWARLQLLGLFADSDVQAIAGDATAAGIQAGQAQGLAKGKELIQEQAPSRPRPPVDGAGADVAAGSREVEAIRALWVDDHPEHNSTIRQVLTDYFGVQFDVATDTDEAMELLGTDPNRYAFVITDMGRFGDPSAGFTLLGKMKAAKVERPTIIYAARTSPEREAEARRKGAFGLTNSPNRLTELVQQVVEQRQEPPAGPS